jgi:integral membrane protein
MPLILSRLRMVSLTEAVSYLLLMFVAMPLKYMLGFGLAVKVIGMIHGVLFMVLFGQLVLAGFLTSWPKSRLWLLALASVVPFMPFFLDRKVRGWMAESQAI